jgi:hypothetical protein
MAMQHDERFVCTGFLRKRNTKAWKMVRNPPTRGQGSLSATYLTIAPSSIDGDCDHGWWCFSLRAGKRAPLAGR